MMTLLRLLIYLSIGALLYFSIRQIRAASNFRRHIAFYRRRSPSTILFSITIGAAASLVMFILAYEVQAWKVPDVAALNAFTTTGLWLSLFFGVATLLSWINTLELLRAQHAQLESYDELVDEMIASLESVTTFSKERLSGVGDNAAIRILSPTPAIGNLSAELSRFRKMLSCLSTIGSEIEPDLVMRADFSTWHLTFLIERAELIANLALKSNSHPQRQAAIRILKQEFDENWFHDLRLDMQQDQPSTQEDRDWAVSKAAGLLNATSDLLSETLAWNEASRCRLWALLWQIVALAHRNADVQVLHLLKQFKSLNNAWLVKAPGDAFPPCIAMVIGDRYYVSWIVPRKNGTRNELNGYVSTDESTRRAVIDLWSHYQILPNTLQGSVLVDRPQEILLSSPICVLRKGWEV